MATSIQTVNASGALVDKADQGFFHDLIDTTLFPIAGADNERMNTSGAFMCALAHELIGSLWGGYIARSRANAGKNAMLGFIY